MKEAAVAPLGSGAVAAAPSNAEAAMATQGSGGSGGSSQQCPARPP